MPRVKIVRINPTNSSKEVTTRSKAKFKSKQELSSSPVLVLKRCGTRAVPQTKSMPSKRQQKKKGTDKDKSNQNLSQNKSNRNLAKNIVNQNELDVNNEKVVQKSNQNTRIIAPDDGKDSENDNDHESEDDYEPDTEDEEEYRSRSYFW